MSSFRFSANTGFLWTELAFLDRIKQAAANGFPAVEFHDEAQDTERAELKAMLASTGVTVIGLNVRNGGTNGCAAMPELADRARQEIAEAVEIAEDIGAGAVHVMAGKVADTATSRGAFKEALRFALERSGKTILIEPLCRVAVDGYFLSAVDQAAEIIGEVGDPRLKIMFDCFHVFHEDGDVPAKFTQHADLVGHVQIAGVPDRHEPSTGAIDYAALLVGFRQAGYGGAIGCEYRPADTTEAGLGWRDAFA